MSNRMKNQRRSPRQARSRATYDAILEAASQILERDGPSAFNTNAVAERAGVSIGTLYQYFPDKEAVLLAAATREFSLTPLLSRQRALLQALMVVVGSIGQFGGGADNGTVKAAVTSAQPAKAARSLRRALGQGTRFAVSVRQAIIRVAALFELSPISIPANARVVARRRQ
jgi:AcrR family transcriptional regulator